MASNNIKGLTVEIGGDTTKLGKALEGVNQKSKDLSAELGQINKLLKMDPSNTDLLAQKQKVLADAIANTGEKLKTLKEAEKQVQEQFERGEVTEEQVRALQREIIATTKKMDSYEKAAKETSDAIEELGQESDDVKDGAKKIEKGSDDAAKSLDDYADAAEKAEKSSGGLSKVGQVVGAGLKAVGAAVAAAGGALVAAAESSREYRTEMGKLDTAFTTAGHSSEAATNTYKALQGVLGETDQAVEAANHLAKLTDNEQDLQKWTDICTGVYATFGASLPIEGLTEAANETAKVGQVTGPLADALNWAGVSEDAFNESLAACSTEQERQALIMETLNGLYTDAATKYKETNAEIIRANQANEEWASVMAEVGGAVEPILTDVKLLGASLVSELVPGVNEVTGAFRSMLNGDEGGGAALGEALSGLISQVLTKVTELLPQVAEMGISLVTSLATSIIQALPQLLTTAVEIGVAILNGLTSAVPLITQAIVDMIPGLVNALVAGIPQIINGAVQLLLAILDAIPLILPPLVAAIPQIVLTVIDGLLAAIPELIEGAVTFLLAIVQAIPLLIDALLPHVPKIVDTVINGLLDNLPLLIDGAIKLFFGILKAIPEICSAVLKQAPSIVGSIVTGLLSAIPRLIEAGGQLLSGLVKGMLNFDIVGAIGKVGGAVVDGFKKAFGIHSPSRVMAEMGEQLDAGLAVGIVDNSDTPLQALDNLTDDMIDGAESLDGLTLERRMVHTFAPGAQTTSGDGIANKLDQIYKAILRGQVIMLDGKALVGSTADRYDTELGQRRVLAERGAL